MGTASGKEILRQTVQRVRHLRIEILQRRQNCLEMENGERGRCGQGPIHLRIDSLR